MTCLREKLNSQRGATILLALLLFLVCCMAAASIMAAGVSNAGKTRSSSVEQQKYLTLSSAIQLIADELEKAEYQGKYDLYEWYETFTTVDNSDPENPVTISYDIYYFYCEQTAGDYSCGDLTAQIPLGKELDKIFSQQFRAKGGESAGFKPLSDADLADSPVVYNLTVTLPGEDKLPGYSYSGSDYDAATTVKVQVELNYDTRHITLTAWLGESDTPPTDKSDTMIAELVVKDLPALDYSPSGRTPKNPSGRSPTDTPLTVPPTKWELSSIKKGVS